MTIPKLTVENVYRKSSSSVQFLSYRSPSSSIPRQEEGGGGVDGRLVSRDKDEIRGKVIDLSCVLLKLLLRCVKQIGSLAVGTGL